MLSHFLPSSALAAWAVLSVLKVVSCGSTSLSDFPTTPAQGIDVKALTPYLSPNVKVYLPGSSGFTTYTTRWSNLEPPTPSIVIAPGTEQDVVKIVKPTEQMQEDPLIFLSQVKFAFDFDIPILAYNGHHGTLTTLGRMDYGIEIYLPQLNTVFVAKDGKTATIGGGVNAKNLTDALWATGKQTGKRTANETTQPVR